MRANDSKSSGMGTVLLSVVAIALAGMAGTLGLIQQVSELGPKVGDIVVFDPLAPMSRDMRASLTAMSAMSFNGRPGAACVIDVQTVHTNGGSMVIEAREPRDAFGYLVHWAGARSSDDGANCGSTADLFMNLEDIEVLAMAAGGYGVPAGKQSAFSRRTATAQ